MTGEDRAGGRRMTLGSLFDGSGGFPLAGAIHGIVPLWASEVEPYPIAVTRSRFPGMRHLGSVTEINGGAVEPVDVITFGSPCQDMSVAGQRAGMKHTSAGDEATTRSGLFYEAIRIIQEMREATNGRHPTFVVWENVPGAFTSRKGDDFRCVLEKIAKIVGGVHTCASRQQMDECRRGHGRGLQHRVARARRAILGSAPTPPSNLPCGRFCRRTRRKNII